MHLRVLRGEGVAWVRVGVVAGVVLSALAAAPTSAAASAAGASGEAADDTVAPMREQADDELPDEAGGDAGEEAVGGDADALDGLLAGWQAGRFFLRSPDERFGLNIGGRVQPRYEYRRRPDGEDTSSFFLRRVRVDLRGHLYFPDERLTFRIMPELAGGSATLRDGWVNYAFAPQLQVRLGQLTVPFQWHRYVSSNRHHFTERGVPSETFGFPSGYDAGVALHGHNEAETLSYGVGLFDGAGRNVRDSDSPGHMASTRVTWAALGELPNEEPDYGHAAQPQVSVGGGLQAANQNEVRQWDLGRSDDNARAHWLTGTGDVSLRWRRFSVVTDGYLRRVWPNDDAVGNYTGWAYMVSTGYFVVPEWIELVGRFSQLMRDRHAGGTRETEWAAGVNLYHRGHRWKTHVQYFNHKTDDGTEHTALVQHHIQF